MKATLALLLLCGFLRAEEQPATDKDAAKKGPPLRVLALGTPPPFRQEMHGDRRVEVEAERGSLPPRQIGVDGNPAVPLALGQPAPLAHVAPLDSIVLRDQAAIWSTLAVPEPLRPKPKLALFWRDPGKSWDNPHSLLLDDGADVFPSGQVRFVNLLPTVAAIRIGESTHELAAGKAALFPAPGNPQTLQIAFMASDGAWLPLHNATLEPATTGMRMEVILYRSDTPNARQPAKALVLRSPVTTSTDKTEAPTAVAAAAK